ncbi:hypothetical protein D6D13_08310 [Aureobasidium pullulans]|uniref:Uncharacterized protein n=1 Tax=Aureobasidium pullulans TaxID=5580 RepID=A0A4S9C6Z7_AURPU|nr:hypothetical protein D6D13_08310 [Aureobasidium pullulans]
MSNCSSAPSMSVIDGLRKALDRPTEEKRKKMMRKQKKKKKRSRDEPYRAKKVTLTFTGDVSYESESSSDSDSEEEQGKEKASEDKKKKTSLYPTPCSRHRKPRSKRCALDRTELSDLTPIRPATWTSGLVA